MSNLNKIIIGALVCLSSIASAAKDKLPTPKPGEVENVAEIAKNLHLDDFKKQKFTRKIKFAVCDISYQGFKAQVGKSLPADTIGPKDESDEKIAHGLTVAEVAARIIKAAEKISHSKVDYELSLYNCEGVKKFLDSVDDMIKKHIDVVLYAQVWDLGNADGTGFIDAKVTEATKAGILWINSSGNFGRTMRRAPITGKVDGDSEWVVFKDEPTDGVTVTCKPEPDAKKQLCPLNLILAWNSFDKEKRDVGTDKSLFLYLYDDKGKPAVDDKGKPIQGETPQSVTKTDKTTVYAHQSISANVGPGTYKVRAKMVSKDWTSTDELRVTVSGDGITMANPSIGETLLPPADNPNVVVIGASQDPDTSTSKSLDLPKINLPSIVKLDDGSAPYHSTMSATMAAARTVLDLAAGQDSDRDATEKRLIALNQKTSEDAGQAKKKKPKKTEEPADETSSTTSPAAKDAAKSDSVPKKKDENESAKQAPADDSATTDADGDEEKPKPVHHHKKVKPAAADGTFDKAAPITSSPDAENGETPNPSTKRAARTGGQVAGNGAATLGADGQPLPNGADGEMVRGEDGRLYYRGGADGTGGLTRGQPQMSGGVVATGPGWDTSGAVVAGGAAGAAVVAGPGAPGIVAEPGIVARGIGGPVVAAAAVEGVRCLRPIVLAPERRYRSLDQLLFTRTGVMVLDPRSNRPAFLMRPNVFTSTYLNLDLERRAQVRAAGMVVTPDGVFPNLGIPADPLVYPVIVGPTPCL